MQYNFTRQIPVVSSFTYLCICNGSNNTGVNINAIFQYEIHGDTCKEIIIMAQRSGSMGVVIGTYMETRQISLMDRVVEVVVMAWNG